MLSSSFGVRRLASQLVVSPAGDPAAVVRHLGAMQAQDYLGALWAVGLRAAGATESAVEQAIAEARIVRTWPMRGTIHFVAPEDARWMLELLAPRVVRRSQGRLRQLELDAATLAAGADAVCRALEGGGRLTRPALYQVLELAGIVLGAQRGLHILGQLAHERLICFGPRDGKQPTFVLLDEWVPPAPPLPPDVALAELARRYFRSHGPATADDFAWWAGLTAREARAGMAAVAGELEQAEVDGQRYAFADHGAAAAEDVFLLPPFDEFLVAYRDRGAVLEPEHRDAVVPGSNGIFHPIVVAGGRVVGTWRRELRPGRVEVGFAPFAPWAAGVGGAAGAAAERYRAFLEQPRLELLG